MGDEKTLLEEIDAMSEILGETVPEEENLEEEGEEQIEESEEEPTKEEESEDEKPLKEEEEETSEIDTNDKEELAILRQKFSDLEKKLVEANNNKEEPPPPPPPPEIKDEEFVKEEDLDEIIRDPKKLNTLLNSIYKKAVDFTRGEVKAGEERVLRVTPDVVKNNIAIISALKKASDKFYEDNKDLQPFKRVVGLVFEELQAKNPDKKYDDILKEVGDEARKRLDLHKKANDKKKDSPPPLPHKKGGRVNNKSKPDANPLVNEIDSMNKSLGL